MKNDLTRLPVVVLDCQTTGSAPSKGHLLEMAWTILQSCDTCEEHKPEVHSFLISLPDGETIPRRVSGMTGISTEMAQSGIEESELAKLLLPVLRNSVPVAHFAVFEQRWIDHLFSTCLPDEEIPRIICTREIARRLYPLLPRKGIRAVAGYFGYSMDEKKRAPDHVRATGFIWDRLVLDLRDAGIMTLRQLNEFLSEPFYPRSGSLNYPLPRETRLSLPDVPGVYRLLSKKGKVLYVGKASSLKRRVNSYFTRRKADEKTLELVSQVHDVFTAECETPLEAALLEFTTIRKFDPPYNIALRKRNGIVFLRKDLSVSSQKPGSGFVWGPVRDSSPALLLHDIFVCMNDGGTIAQRKLNLDYYPLERRALESGFSIFRDELLQSSSISMNEFLLAGRAAWLRLIDEREKETEIEVADRGAVKSISAEDVRKHLEWVLARGTRDIRMGAWLCQLGWSSLLWKPAFSDRNRCLEFNAGKVVSSEWIVEEDLPYRDSGTRIERQLQLNPDSYDRVKVLDSELRRITLTGSFKGIRTPGGKYLGKAALTDLYRFV